MWQDLQTITTFLFNTFDEFVPLYISGGLFSIPFAMYFVRRITKLIRHFA